MSEKLHFSGPMLTPDEIEGMSMYGLDPNKVSDVNEWRSYEPVDDETSVVTYEDDAFEFGSPGTLRDVATYVDDMLS